MRAHIEHSIPIAASARTIQLRGMFDLPPTEASTMQWDVDLPVEDKPWNVGLVVGPSGSGKTSIAREFWPDQLAVDVTWPDDKAVIEAFPSGMSIKEVVALLSSVGFSSPPAWLRPFRVLSNGEQFRATVARRLADDDDLVVLDEFTSVVDRTVAQIGSAAVAKAVRQRDRRLVALSCHYDVEDWLQPDWVYQPHIAEFTWRSVQPRPGIGLDVARSDHTAWRLFGPHHYLSASLNRSAACFVGFWTGRPVVFLAVLPFPGRGRVNCWRAHRLVTLPDYQGVGIGNRFCDYMAGVFAAAGRSMFVTTAHPARVSTLARNPLWKITRQPSLNSRDTGRLRGTMSRSRAVDRLTAGFRYVGGPVEATALLDCLWL